MEAPRPTSASWSIAFPLRLRAKKKQLKPNRPEAVGTRCYRSLPSERWTFTEQPRLRLRREWMRLSMRLPATECAKSSLFTGRVGTRVMGEEYFHASCMRDFEPIGSQVSSEYLIGSWEAAALSG